MDLVFPRNKAVLVHAQCLVLQLSAMYLNGMSCNTKHRPETSVLLFLGKKSTLFSNSRPFKFSKLIPIHTAMTLLWHMVDDIMASLFLVFRTMNGKEVLGYSQKLLAKWASIGIAQTAGSEHPKSGRSCMMFLVRSSEYLPKMVHGRTKYKPATGSQAH